MNACFRGALAACLIAALPAWADAPGMPKTEADYIAAFRAAQPLYQQAPNELKKTTVKSNLIDAMHKSVPGGRAIDWVGTLVGLGTTGKGKAYVKIEIDSGIWIMTTNNDFSDALTHTLIDGNSELYSALAEMKKGQRVRFTATLRDLIDLTEEGKVMEPEMEARFIKIEAVR